MRMRGLTTSEGVLSRACAHAGYLLAIIAVSLGSRSIVASAAPQSQGRPAANSALETHSTVEDLGWTSPGPRLPNVGTGRPTALRRSSAPGQPRPTFNREPTADDQSERPEDRPPLSEVLLRRGDLTLRGGGATIESALFTISELWNVNIVVGTEVHGAVSGSFKAAPLREILDSILLANGYSYRAVGESLVVQPVAQVGSANPLFRSVTIPVKHSNLDELVEAAQLLKSGQGQVRALTSARSLLVIDYEDRVESIVRFADRMEEAAAELLPEPGAAAADRLEVAYFHTQFVPAEHVKGPLLAVLSADGRVETMPIENRVIMVDYADHIGIARRVLEKLDRPRPQVRITALIYDLSLEDVEKLGLNWGSAAKGRNLNVDGNPNQVVAFDTETLAPLTGAGGTLTVRSLTRYFDINTIVQLLQNANDARLLADPNVTVTDNETAEWKSVSEIPFQQITQSELGGQIGTTAFKEAGITLRVKPIIAADGTIEMVVEPEFSRLAGFTPGENQPIIDTRRASTTVRVANRQTIVIGGLRQRSDNGEFNGIPFLKDVRGIGPLFRSRDTNVRESELVVFIMPEIVGYDCALSCRNHRALDTIGCRLAAVPHGEGCPPTDGSCGPAATCDDMLLPLPATEEVEFGKEVAPAPSTSGNQGHSSLRANYQTRFRDGGQGRPATRIGGERKLNGQR